MPHPIEPSTLRILTPDGKTVGTGFLVTKNLAVTCMHVVSSAGLDVDGRIAIQFTDQKHPTTAIWLDQYFISGADVAILQVDDVPSGVSPLRLASSVSKAWNKLYSFGYATTIGQTGLGSLGTFITQKTGGNYIQFDSPHVDHGFSGAPLFDENLKVVIGMINMGNDKPGRNEHTTFAIPSETIWQVCSQLKPPTPVLPRRNPIVEGINLLPYDYDQRIQNFLGEYLGSEAHPVPFGGRDDAMKMINDWLDVSTPYLLLAAPAGRGKSALLVRWLDSLSSREDLALVFVPVSIRFGTNMERVFYAALAARLAFLHGDDVPACPETSTAVYRGLVSDYLSKPLANGRTLLVVLDGLDEAADWQAGADFVPAQLPAGVRVVVSARFLAGDSDPTSWLRRLNWERSGLASAPLLVPLDRAGVADVLLKMSVPLKELSRNVDIVAELYRLSQGDPLLVGLYVGDLWEKGEAVLRLKPKNLADIQPGYKGYFDRWWDDQKKLWGKEKPWLEKHVRAVRNLLAAALGPLFKSDFQSLDSELQSDYIADVLNTLQRFIIGDNKLQGYIFSHPQLGQFFWESLTPSEQALVEDRFLDWGEQTLQEFTIGKRDPKKKADVPAYVVRNYGAHLTRAGRPFETWLPVIYQQEWAQAWFSVEGAYGGYLQDVNRVWEYCKMLDHETISAGHPAARLGAQIRCALIEASLHSLAGNIPAELLWPLVRDGIWTLAQVWVTIRQMPEPKQQSKAIIALLPHLDDYHLLEALVTAREIKNEWYRADVLAALAERLAADELEQIQTAMQNMEHKRPRAKVLSALARRLPEDELGQIWAAAREMKDEWSYAYILSALAQRLPELAGKALVVTWEIRNEGDRAEVLSTLAQHLPERELKQIWASVQEMKYERSRAEVLSALAQRLPELAEDALAAARKAGVLSRADVLRVLAHRLPQDKLRQVWADAREMKDNQERSYAHVLSILTQRLPEEELGQVWAATWTMRDDWGRARVLSALAQRLPSATNDALITVMYIRDKRSLAPLLSALAHYLPELAGEVLAIVREVTDEHDRAKVLSALAQHLLEGELGQIWVAMREINSKPYRDIVFAVLVQRLPNAINDALTVTREMTDEKYYVEVLSTLAQRLPEGELGKIWAATQKIKDEQSRAKVLRILADRLPQDELRQVWAEARGMEYERSRAEVLGALAQRLPEGELGKIWAEAREMKDEGSYALVLSILAQRLPEEELGQVWAAILWTIRDDRGRARVLSALAQRLPEGELRQVWTVMQTIRDDWGRTHVLIALAQRLPERELEQVWAAAREIQNESTRADILIHLAQHLPQHLPQAIEEALVVARNSKNEWIRFFRLKTLALHSPEIIGEVISSVQRVESEEGRMQMLSELAEDLPEGELEQVLLAARELKYVFDRADVLGTLVQRVPNLVGETLSTVLENQNEESRTKVLSMLAQPLTYLSTQECYSYMEITIPRLAQRTRADLFSDLAALMPVIIHLGTDDTPREIYQAIRDVTIWWP